jgi:2-polyprenyl-6-methoxyphenol hydroxylase-like FAD-dependent oxidoreductase
MVVQARTLEFYAQLGLADAIVAQGVRVNAVHLREHGRDIATIAFGDIGAGVSPYPFALCYPQDDHERFLVDELALDGITVEWNTELKSFNQDEARVRAVLDTADGAEVCEADYLCGCDGAHSSVRHGLGLAFSGGAYDQLFYVADVAIEAGFRTDIFVSLAEHGLALMLPVRSRGVQRLIGIVPVAFEGRDDLSFEDLRPSAEALLGVRVVEVNWFSTYRVHHRVAAGFRGGRAFIAGDAGHIHSPAGGQGMNTGIGDAVNLAWKLAKVLQGRTGSAILDSYEAERLPFARTLVQTTDRAFQGMTGQGWASQLLRTWILPHLAPTLTGFAAVRRAMFATVSQTRIAYRQSPLSRGRAGGVHGGDRLPWVPSADGGNFASLAAMDWRIHVYGDLYSDAGAALTDAAAKLRLPIDRFGWTAAAAHGGLQQHAAYLVRPDGHVALASTGQDAAELTAFAGSIGLR